MYTIIYGCVTISFIFNDYGKIVKLRSIIFNFNVCLKFENIKTNIFKALQVKFFKIIIHNRGDDKE